MARPQPIILPTIQRQDGLGQDVGQLLGTLLGQGVTRGRQRRQEEEAQQQFAEQFSSIFQQPVPQAGPPTAEMVEAGEQLPDIPGEVPPQVQGLIQTLAQTAGGRQLGQQQAVQALGGFLKPAAAPEGIFGKVTDITKFTPASIRAAEKSGLRSDLVADTKILNQLATGKDIFNAEKDLRKEFTTLSGTFRDIRDASARITESAKNPSAAGDLALIFNFMKMLDPRSVVRESEFRSAEQAKAWLSRSEEEGIIIPSTIRTVIQKAQPGEKGAFLLPEQRKDFVGRSKQFFSRQESQHKKREDQFKGIAKRNKLDARNIVLDLTDPKFAEEEAGAIQTRLQELAPQGEPAAGSPEEAALFQQLLEEGF